MEIAPGTLVSARVLDYKPAARKPLAEVSDAIKAQLTDVEARRLALDAGKALLADLRAGRGTAVAFGSATSVSRVERSDLPAEAVTEIFRTEANKLPAYAGVALPSGDYGIYQIAGVTKQTGSAHLAKLLDTQLVAVETQGRHRYYRLAHRDVAQLLESLMGVAFRTGALRVRTRK